MAEAKGKKRLRYPTKTTLNLAMRERTSSSPSVLLPVLLLLAAAIGLFTKFAVIDQLTRVSVARASLAGLQDRLEEVQAVNEDYASVAAEYSRYFYSGFTEEELAEADRMEVLGLLDEMMTRARIGSASLKDNTLTVTLSGVTLQGLSDLMRDLKDKELVTDVSVYTAGTRSEQLAGEELASVAMTITLVQPEKDGDAS